MAISRNISVLLELLHLISSVLTQNAEIASNTSPREYLCVAPGYFPHPQDSTKYYHCTYRSSYSPELISYMYRCSQGQCYDAASRWRCSLQACVLKPPPPPTNDTMEGEFTCIRDNLQQDAQLICQEDTLKLLKKQLPKMLEFTAFRGDPYENLVLSLREANLNMRENYRKMIENVGKNVFPLIVATDAEPDYFGVGGVFKVYYRDGSMQRIIPGVHHTFEIHKSLSHLVLGVFSIVSPYFRNPNSLNWQGPLKVLQEKVRDVLHILGRLDIDQPGENRISSQERQWATEILLKVIKYTENAITGKSFNHEEYRIFANDLTPLIEKSMARAAKAHAEDTIEALQKLKNQMGEDLWRQAYVIIPTVWPVSLYNIRLQALEKVMSFEQIKSQVLIVEGSMSEADAKTTLGRVLVDRAVAQLVWEGVEDPSVEAKDHVFSLSTRRDLLSSTSNRALNAECERRESLPEKEKCPFSGRNNGEGMNNAFGINDKRMPVFATMLRH